MRTIVDAFAQYERALIRARTRNALAVKKTRGERTGTVPFGFDVAADGVRLVPDPEEQAVVVEVRRLHAAGMSLRGIAAELAARGVLGRGAALLGGNGARGPRRPLGKTQIERIVNDAPPDEPDVQIESGPASAPDTDRIDNEAAAPLCAAA